MDGQSRIIVVKKKKKSHGGHHGGSWKVAYADFVTAMMAFFLVMWIMGMDQGVKDIVEGYFANPVGFQQGFSGGTNPISNGNSPVDMSVRVAAMMLSREVQQANFEETAEAIEEALQSGGILDLDAEVEIAVTDDGLRIELMENSQDGEFFAVASAQVRPGLEALLSVVARELAEVGHSIILEGHTDGRPFRTSSGYSNWELSVDRANAARRILVEQGMSPGRFAEVRGYADRNLKVAGNRMDPRNRRITILMPFNEPLDLSDGSRIVPADSTGAGVGIVPGGLNGS